LTSLRFSKKADRLVSGSDDGMITIWRIKDWVCVSFKPAHKGSVTDLDVNQGHDIVRPRQQRTSLGHDDLERALLTLDKGPRLRRVSQLR
jgi:WD40 repeat protein